MKGNWINLAAFCSICVVSDGVGPGCTFSQSGSREGHGGQDLKGFQARMAKADSSDPEKVWMEACELKDH